MATIWAFDHKENKYTLYCGEDCIKKFCTYLREHATNVINFEKKMLPLTKKRAKITPVCDRMLHLWKNILKKFVNDKNYHKVRDHCHFKGKYQGAAYSICD